MDPLLARKWNFPFSAEIPFSSQNGIESTQFHLIYMENSIFVSLGAINGFIHAMGERNPVIGGIVSVQRFLNLSIWLGLVTAPNAF